jgi:hypothetical protein
MSKQNFKSQAKRKRELAKLDKRQAKDQKRALKRTDQAGTSLGLQEVVPAAVPTAASRVPPVAGAAPPAAAPLTLAQAVERWKNTKIVKPKHR